MAEGKLVKRSFHISEEEDGENSVEFLGTVLAYLQTRANHTEDSRIDGVQLADELHRAAAELGDQRYDGRRVGHELARCDISNRPDDEVSTTKGKEKKNAIKEILAPYVEGAYEQGGRQLEEYLRNKLCNKSGIGEKYKCSIYNVFMTRLHL